jgi:hypothetical protein
LFNRKSFAGRRIPLQELSAIGSSSHRDPGPEAGGAFGTVCGNVSRMSLKDRLSAIYYLDVHRAPPRKAKCSVEVEHQRIFHMAQVAKLQIALRAAIEELDELETRMAARKALRRLISEVTASPIASRSA